MGDQPPSAPIPNDNAPCGTQLVQLEEHTSVGAPVTFVIGPLAGRTIQASLRELQKADVGRKFLKRDRRPLDPPPCCILTLYDTIEPGTPQERQEEILDYEDILPEGWICNVEMFADSPSSESASLPDGTTSLNADDVIPPSSQDVPAVTGHALTNSTLGDNLTSALTGSTIVQAIKFIVDGHRAILFLFPDLSCRLEGSFRLRYRVFNLMCIASGMDQRPAMASCLGGTFTVYNSRTFPGLDEPTPLTKSLSIMGVHSNNRESIRRGGVRRIRAENV